MTLTKRSTKGSELTHNELDANFDHVLDMANMVEATDANVLTDAERSAIAANTAKVSNATHTGDVTGGTALTIAAGAVDIAMLSASGTASSSTYLRGDNTWGTPAGGGDVVDDTTPQLGGHLDGQGYDITGLGTLSMTEQASANADVAGDGQFWVQTATPNIPMYTDDAGSDAEILTDTSGQSAADLASTSNGFGASLIGIEDSAGDITATDVEGALAEAWTRFTPLTGSGSPAGVVTPTFVGQRYTDTVANAGYNAVGATSGDWVADIDDSSGTSIGTKATPIAADKVFQFDSASSDAPVTSTWTQIISALSLITDTSTDTLTNKTINTASNTITVVEADISDLGSYITASSTDTLTNKTITDPKTAHGVNAQTGTTYTLVLTDVNKKVTMSNASANTLTIPLNSSVAFPTGTIIGITMLGAGTTTVDGATGVTVNGVSGGGAAISAQYTGVTLTKLATDTWLMEGNHGTVA